MYNKGHNGGRVSSGQSQARIRREICVLGAAALLAVCAPAIARADAACEKKLGATGMFMTKTDFKAICDLRPSVATQDCLAELLVKGKGKLRNLDLMNVYGICKVDPSKEVRDCFVSKLGTAWNDPSYRPAANIGDECFLARKRYSRVTVRAQPKSPAKTPAPNPAPAPTPVPNK